MPRSVCPVLLLIIWAMNASVILWYVFVYAHTHTYIHICVMQIKVRTVSWRPVIPLITSFRPQLVKTALPAGNSGRELQLQSHIESVIGTLSGLTTTIFEVKIGSCAMVCAVTWMGQAFTSRPRADTPPSIEDTGVCGKTKNTRRYMRLYNATCVFGR